MRVSRKLNRVNGVVAVVNYVTERATVSAPPEILLRGSGLLGEFSGHTHSLASATGRQSSGSGLHADRAVSLAVLWTASQAVPYEGNDKAPLTSPAGT